MAVCLTRDSAGQPVVVFEEDVGYGDKDELERAVFDGLRQASEQLVIDMEKCVFLDSLSLNYLMEASLRLMDSGGKLVLSNPNENLIRLLEIVGLTQRENVRILSERIPGSPQPSKRRRDRCPDSY